MCGVCGIVGPGARAFLEDVERMTAALTHRGPDDSGVWKKPGSAGEPAVALGHRRLSIIDLSPLGHQPMHSKEGDLTLSYNGEVYNFRELRHELVALGHSFRSESDSEVILEAYRAWGLEAFDRFNGMFALALWDAPGRRLVLVRDRLGIKPLFYRESDGVLTFGSELGALRCHRGFEPAIDRVSLGQYLRYGYVPGERTIYTGVRRLLPGHIGIWKDGRLETRPFWRLVDGAEEPGAATYGEAVDRLEALLGDAVELRLVSDVPLGAFLSGGVDSSTVVALMQQRARGRVRTFSIGFEEEEYDESSHARDVAKHLGTDHTELTCGRSLAVEVAHQLPLLFDEPFADRSAIPTTILSRLTRDHVTVALSGDGGDELFGGYDRYERMRRLLPLLGLPGVVRHGLAAASALLPGGALRNGLAHLVANDALELAGRLNSFFPSELLAAACGSEAGLHSALLSRTFDDAPTRDPVARVRFADCRTYLVDDILTKVDRASMSVALEARVPILDHRVVRFGLSLPESILRHGGETKAPLRGVLHRHVPRELIDRPKRGFGIPLHVLLARELREWEARYLTPDRLAEEGHFDPEGARGLVAAAKSEHPVATFRLWILLCFQRWFAWNHRGERDH